MTYHAHLKIVKLSIFQTNENRSTGFCSRRDVSLDLLGLPLIVSCSGGFGSVRSGG
jgi:hypothetical protein